MSQVTTDKDSTMARTTRTHRFDEQPTRNPRPNRRRTGTRYAVVAAHLREH